MSELVNSTYISLDGVIESPQTWPATGGFGAEGNKIQADLVLSCSAVIMGRHTYDVMAPVWPTMSGNPLADKMNAMPKYVASSTLADPEWNNTQAVHRTSSSAMPRDQVQPHTCRDARVRDRDPGLSLPRRRTGRAVITSVHDIETDSRPDSRTILLLVGALAGPSTSASGPRSNSPGRPPLASK
jgi:hypothetical protein